MDEKLETTEKLREQPFMLFTVTLAQKNEIVHYIVKAASAIQALSVVQQIKKAPVLGVHITEYVGYIDAIQEMPPIITKDSVEQKEENNG